jgi:DNA polymerase
MPWTERQAALLRGMGLRLWAPPDAPSAVAGAPVAPTTTTAVATNVRPEVPPAEPAARAPAPRPTAPSIAARPAAAPPVQPARAASSRADVSALDWPALRLAVADCRACSLCQSRRQTVFGTGHLQAQWLLVGEAPGEQEDEQGEPFVGAAGQLLDRMLAALGLTRAADGPQRPEQRVYIANTLKCRPPRNRNPTAEEMASCEPFLVRQVQLLGPRLILALGRFAVQALLRSDEPIGKLRGRVHHYEGVPVIVSYHPAYLLRSPHEKAKAWEDLCLAASLFEAGAAR